MSKPRDKSKEFGQDVSSMTELSEKDVTALRTHAQLLQTFHHRNKNQHRRSPWWRHFDHFRRDTKAFVAEVEGVQGAVVKDQPNVASQKSKNKGKDEKTSIAERMQALKAERERLEARKTRCLVQMQRRKTSWSQVLIMTWYRNFSQLTADPQFAVMGLFLIAALSKVCGILDIIPVKNEADAGLPSPSKVNDFLSLDAPGDQDLGRGSKVDVDDLGIDAGVRIERAPSEDDSMAEAPSDLNPDQNGPADEQIESRMEGSPAERRVPPSAAGKGKASPLVVPVAHAGARKDPKITTGLKRKDGSAKSKVSSKKSKKSGNAIDDLFSGLF